MSIYFKKGVKAKQLVGIYRNPYIEKTYEYDEWKRGYDSVPFEPVDYEVELEDCSDFFDQFEPTNIKPKSLV